MLGDPFDTLALRSNDELRTLFVKTHDIVEQVDPLIDHFMDLSAFIRTVMGPRGAGKSTCLWYMVSKARGFENSIAAYIPYQYSILSGKSDPQYAVGLDALNRIVHELANALNQRYQSRPPPSELKKILRGIQLLDTDYDVTSENFYRALSNSLDEILNLGAKSNLKGLVAIDNYDKVPDEKVALGFLRSSYARQLFERLQKNGVSIVFTAEQSWGYSIAADPEFSYLGHPINLGQLSPAEAEQIVRVRLQAKKSTNVNLPFPFSDQALSRIVVARNGIARDILETCRSCLLQAASMKIPQIDESWVTEYLSAEQRAEKRYYETMFQGGIEHRIFEYEKVALQLEDYPDYLSAYWPSRISSRELVNLLEKMSLLSGDINFSIVRKKPTNEVLYNEEMLDLKSFREIPDAEKVITFLRIDASEFSITWNYDEIANMVGFIVPKKTNDALIASIVSLHAKTAQFPGTELRKLVELSVKDD